MTKPSSKDIRNLITSLEKGKFMAECSECGDTFSLKQAALFAFDEFTPEAEALYKELKVQLAERRKALQEMKTKGPERSQYTTRSVNVGFILERIAPAFDQFPFDRNDCRSLFDPIDYVIFEGLHRKGRVEKIIFADIKTGEARLNKTQKQIREAVKSKKVNFKLY
jgi:predicted Holliday junction resolvase-like endonuclease